MELLKYRFHTATVFKQTTIKKIQIHHIKVRYEFSVVKIF